MKGAVALAALFFVAAPFFGEERSRHKDFRSAEWGMSREQVRQLEGAELIEDDGHLSYAVEINGWPALCSYGFGGGKLAVSSCTFQRQHQNPNRYVEDAQRLVYLLSRQYGAGTYDHQWSNQLYADDTESYGKAIAAGHLSLTWRWSTPRTDMHLKLAGDNFRISMTLEYQGKEFADAYFAEQAEGR